MMNSKLILGVPWYGYRYACASFYPGNGTCAIKHVPFRGANCSDAAGQQVLPIWLTQQYFSYSKTITPLSISNNNSSTPFSIS